MQLHCDDKFRSSTSGGNAHTVNAPAGDGHTTPPPIGDDHPANPLIPPLAHILGASQTHRRFRVAEDFGQLAGKNPALLAHASNLVSRNQTALASPFTELLGFDRSVFLSFHPDDPFISHLIPLSMIPPKD